MAENESLDLARTRRWQRVYRAIVGGQSAEQIADLAEVCLRQTINAIHKPVDRGGPPQVPLGDLLNALECGPKEVERIVQDCKGHDFARLFQNSGLDTPCREVAAENFLLAIYDKYSDQIAMQCVQDGRYTFARVRLKLDQIQSTLRPGIRQLAHQLAANPNRPLRRSKSSKTETITSTINTESVLSESLLGLR
jgi:hypothetical protein